MLWRDSDKALISGDAVVTTNQESAYAVWTQKPELHGPPKYFTQNWEQAESSLKRLAQLRPKLLLPGHGPAIEGPEVWYALDELATRFKEVAVPKDGDYVREPVDAGSGSAYRPVK